MGELSIERATRAHVPAIHRIEEASFPAPWRAEFFTSEILAEGRFNLVALRDAQVIGYLFSMWIFDEMHINKIAVAAEARRHGIADALMDRALTHARTRNITSITLEVRQSNEGAQAFYRHLDFTPTYVRKNYYPDGEAAVVMTKAL
jgi:ribosomal-protein-alanine N-acetyltransferase